MAQAARALLSESGPLSIAFPGYEDRPGQLAMADAVEAALAKSSVLVCEAATGTGKTLAYLVPAILSGLRVVVSTATKALQDQICEKDIPIIRKYLKLEPRVAVAKGLSNYLCLRRYHEFRKSPDALLHVKKLPFVEKWSKETLVGDFAEVPGFSDTDELRSFIASSVETRIGQECSYVNDCFVTRMKQSLQNAQLIVVNHHLFFADLSVKRAMSKKGQAAAGVLPPYDAVIFDEAHQLENIASDFLGIRFSDVRLYRLLRDVTQMFSSDVLRQKLFKSGNVFIESVQKSVDSFFQQLQELHGGVDNRISLDAGWWQEKSKYHGETLDASLNELSQFCETNAVDETVRQVTTRIEMIRTDLKQLLNPPTHHVLWLEHRARSLAVGLSPIDLGDDLRELVFESIGSVVLASATLSTGTGNFDYFRYRMGLTEEVSVPVQELTVTSPFQFESSAILYTPRDLPDVTSSEFIPLAAERAAALIELTAGGAFLLCTSVRSMRAFASEVRRHAKQKVMVQGEAPKGQLLDHFRRDMDSVLIATMSFWEGVDVPGKALRLVMIEKLPFLVPSDPVVQARCNSLEAHGRNAFLSYSVPQAVLTLKQGLGRLIRTKNDEGIMAILDRRILTKSYGKVMLESLPPAPRTERLEDVQLFWKLKRESRH